MTWLTAVVAAGPGGFAALAGIALISYLVGGIPWAYIIAKSVTGEDITAHGTGNVGAMNVRRTTGSWGWFAIAMVADGLKGLIPVLAARFGAEAIGIDRSLAMQAAVLGAVLGHNYSVWLAIVKRRYVRTGKGLATGGGALLGYAPIYFAAVVVVGLGTIALTRYMMAGQVAAAAALPLAAFLTRSDDWPFALLMGVLVYVAHHGRFLGMLRGEEPKMYTRDRMGPRG